jgi:CMP-N,N'-diacetyllegionaminic acid synthase
MTVVVGARIATICARGGSKGLPGKNLRPFPRADGDPLIVHTIRQALACPLISKVYVSTDDPAIAAVAEAAGATVPYLRPAELATDAAAKLPVIEHLIRHVEAGGQVVSQIVDLQPTSPLRQPADLIGAIEAAESAELVVSASDCGFNPWFNMVTVGADGWGHLAAEAVSRDTLRGQQASRRTPRVSFVRRQDAPRVLGLNGSIYVWQRAALSRAAIHGLWSVKVKVFEMPRERSADIDDLLDFQWAAWLAQRAKSTS